MNNQKTNIGNNFKNKNWDKKQKEFEEIFKRETKNLRDELISILDKASSNIDNYLVNWLDNLNKFILKI